MSLSIGIVGLPNVGKSTLFNALTGAASPVADYPFTTVEPHIGTVPMPDARLERLAEIFSSAKATPATVRFVDIAGLVKGAGQGEGLGNQFLANIRDVHAICHVVRAFRSSRVAHVYADLDPKRDIEIIETELAVADLQTLDRRLPGLEKEAKLDKSLLPRLESLRQVREVVASGRMLSREKSLAEADYADLQLLAAKPVLYVFNADQELADDVERRGELAALVAPAEAVFLDAQFEAELTELTPDDRAELLGSSEASGLGAVVEAAYRTLGLQSFLTANENEARAWSIRSGTSAYEGAGLIHTDFQRGFIAAEVIAFDQLVESGSWQAAKAAGLVRTEGRGYLLKPNDVVQFHFNI